MYMYNICKKKFAVKHTHRHFSIKEYVHRRFRARERERVRERERERESESEREWEWERESERERERERVREDMCAYPLFRIEVEMNRHIARHVLSSSLGTWGAPKMRNTDRGQTFFRDGRAWVSIRVCPHPTIRCPCVKSGLMGGPKNITHKWTYYGKFASEDNNTSISSLIYQQIRIHKVVQLKRYLNIDLHPYIYIYIYEDY